MKRKRELLNFNRAMLLLFLIAIFIAVKTALTAPSDLEKEADIVMSKLTGHDQVSLVSSNQIDIEKLRMLDKMEYNQVKDILGVKSDFCIYFEDAEGNLVKIDNTDMGIGSDNIYLNGEPCR